MEFEISHGNSVRCEPPYIVRISDFIRRRIIGCLIDNGFSLQESYDLIHQIHFINEQEGLTFGSTSSQKNHDTSLSVREHDSMSILPLCSLHDILPKLFKYINHPTYNGDFINNISILDMLLRLCHIPHDGAGRTNEDFLILFGRKNDLNLTFSRDGYRGIYDMSSLVHERMVAHKIFLEEVKKLDTICHEEIAGLVLQVQPRDLPSIVLKKREQDLGFLLYQLQKHNAGLALLEALRNPTIGVEQIQKLFPLSFGKTREIIIKACSQRYTYLTE